MTTKLGKKLKISIPKTLNSSYIEEELSNFYKYTKLKRAFNPDEVDKNFEFIYDIPTFLGIEVEVEGVYYNSVLPKFWEGKTDGSLRGVPTKRAEFYSVPLTPQQAVHASKFLWSVLDDLGDPQFTWRTSVQVHLSALDLNSNEIRNLLTLTALFEPILFKYVGKNRSQSVFCVPLTESILVAPIRHCMANESTVIELASVNWMKYSAINLTRLAGQGGEPPLGTVEFRHLGGTKDVDIVLWWLAIITRLYQHAKLFEFKKLKDVVKTMTPNAYLALGAEIFDKAFSKLDFSVYPNRTIGDVKQWFIEKNLDGPVQDKSLLAALARKRVGAPKKPVEVKEKLPPNLSDEAFYSIPSSWSVSSVASVPPPTHQFDVVPPPSGIEPELDDEI